MKKQLTDVHTLLKFIDPDLYNHLGLLLHLYSLQ